MVTPPAFSAAIPVGATTIKCLCVLDANIFKKVVFPVPALPVRKMWSEVPFINRVTKSTISVVSTSFIDFNCGAKKDTKERQRNSENGQILREFGILRGLRAMSGPFFTAKGHK